MRVWSRPGIKRAVGWVGAFALLAVGTPASASSVSLDLQLRPNYFVYLGAQRKIINDTPHPLGAAMDRVVLDDFSGGFRVIHHAHLSAGATYDLGWNYPDQLMRLFPGVGVTPIVGSSLYSERYVRTREQAHGARALRVPRSASDLDTWQVGDSVFYMTEGGMYFGVHSDFAGAGYLAQGNWSVYVSKESARTAYVKVTRGDLKGFSAYLGGIVTQLSVSQFKSADRAFSFEYDLSSHEARKAYADAVRGSLIGSERLAARGTGGVKRIETISSKAWTRMSSLWIGAPFLLSASQMESTSHEFVDTISHEDGSKSQADYGVYLTGQSSEVFFDRTEQFQSFVGTSYRNRGGHDGDYDDYFGEFSWSYESDKGADWTFEREMKRLSGLTQMRDLSVAVPKASQLRYHAAHFTMTIPQKATRYLMSHGEDERRALQFAALAADNAFNTWVRQRSWDYWDQARRYGRQVRGDDDIRRETHVAVRGMVKALVDMKRASSGMVFNHADFAKAYARFGKSMIKNEFSFAAALAMLRGQHLMFDYTIEGERINRMTRSWDVNYWRPETPKLD